MTALTLSDQELGELQKLIDDFRHKEAAILIQFIVRKQQEQQKNKPSPPFLNGGRGEHEEGIPAA